MKVHNTRELHNEHPKVGSPRHLNKVDTPIGPSSFPTNYEIKTNKANIKPLQHWKLIHGDEIKWDNSC